MPADGLLLAAYDYNGTGPSALWRGATITGDATTGCVWIGNPVNHYAALWFPGYWARFGPLRIYNEDGEQLWSELDSPRDIGGGFVEVFNDRIPRQCRTGDRAWWVNPLKKN